MIVIDSDDPDYGRADQPFEPLESAVIISVVAAGLVGPVGQALRPDLFGSATSSFDMKAVLSGGVLLARLPKGTLGEDTARLVGALLVASV